MGYKVNLDFVEGKLNLNGKEYLMDTFTPTNELETEVKNIIDRFYTPVYVQQMSIDFDEKNDDISELVKSDMFKGDKHSQDLLGEIK